MNSQVEEDLLSCYSGCSVRGLVLDLISLTVEVILDMAYLSKTWNQRCPFCRRVVDVCKYPTTSFERVVAGN